LACLAYLLDLWDCVFTERASAWDNKMGEELGLKGRDSRIDRFELGFHA